MENGQNTTQTGLTNKGMLLTRDPNTQPGVGLGPETQLLSPTLLSPLGRAASFLDHVLGHESSPVTSDATALPSSHTTGRTPAHFTKNQRKSLCGLWALNKIRGMHYSDWANHSPVSSPPGAWTWNQLHQASWLKSLDKAAPMKHQHTIILVEGGWTDIE